MRQPPGIIYGVNIQAVARDRVERQVQLQAWAEWWSENPRQTSGQRWNRDCVIAELSGKPQPSLFAYRT